MRIKRGSLRSLSLEDYINAARETGATSMNQLGPAMGVGKSSLKQEFNRHRTAEEYDALEEVLNENKAKGTSRASIRPFDSGHIALTANTSEEQNITRSGCSTHDTIEAKGVRIKTLDQLLEATEIDLDVWRVKDYTVNTYEQHSVDRGLVTLYQVKARIERIQAAIDMMALRDAVVEAMQEHSPAPVYRYMTTPLSTPDPNLALEISIPDLHLGKLAHAEETGDNYDGKIAVEAFRYVFRGLLAHAQNMNVSRIIFPVGNDLLHVDNAENTTTGGTRQDTDGRWYKSVRRAVDLMVEAIDSMAQIAPVDVVIVPGNHARLQEGMLSEIMRAWYRKEERVVIHDSPAPRKYIQWGTTLLGFTHGDGPSAKELPLIMATEVPELWADTTHRAWSIGHLHQRRRNKFGSVEEIKGVEVRMSPSLAGTDAWHSEMGYIGNLRAAEAYCHDTKQGEIARFRATLPEDFGV